MKHGLLCLLLLPACSFFSSSDAPEVHEYVVTWYCISPEGCEYVDEAMRIDRATSSGYEFSFASTQDASFSEDADALLSQALPVDCFWLYYLSFFGHELERSKICENPGGFELELSIPNEDPTTHSLWVVSGRDVRFL